MVIFTISFQVRENCLPTYQEYSQSSTSFNSPTLDVSRFPQFAQNPTVLPGNQTGHQQHSNQCYRAQPNSLEIMNSLTTVSALTGVPFELGPGCASIFAARDFRNCVALHEITLDSHRYEYDFNLEHSYLSEQGAFNEDVNMEVTN